MVRWIKFKRDLEIDAEPYWKPLDSSYTTAVLELSVILAFIYVRAYVFVFYVIKVCCFCSGSGDDNIEEIWMNCKFRSG
ncbi:putative cell surface glycoprotein [Trichinella spiralis]|uniref:Cell surface glycoprotein n=1 Tax=Trichinella spiralis TaxID=6334 RepID=A0ABR3KTH2_TRISP